jgi:hypothetical protein
MLNVRRNLREIVTDCRNGKSGLDLISQCAHHAVNVLAVALESYLKHNDFDKLMREINKK